MATATIGTASGGYYNYRGTNVDPNAVGSSVGTGNWIVNSFSIQMASGSSSGQARGCIWDANGNLVWISGYIANTPADTSPTFGAKTFSPAIYLGAGTYYFGFSKPENTSLYWDCVNGDNSSRCGNTDGGGLTYGGTGTIYRRLVGSIDYTDVYAPATPNVSVSPGNGTLTVYFSSNGDGGMGITEWNYSLDNVNWSGAIGSGHVIGGLSNGVGYTVYVRARNAVGYSGSGASSGTPRTVPTMGAVNATANVGSISVSWSVTSNGGAGVQFYHVYRNGVYLTQTTSTSYLDNVGNNFTAYYTVYAYNDAGWSGGVNSATVTTPTQATAPASLILTKGVNNMLATWTAPTNTGGTPITGYRLERSLNGSTWTTVINTNASTFSYNDTGLSPATLYYYRVFALNAAGQSPATNANEKTIGGYLKVYNGSQFNYSLPKYYDSTTSTWKEGSIFTYNGSIWIPGEAPPQ